MQESAAKRRRLQRSPTPEYKLDDEDDNYVPYVPVAQRRQAKLAKLTSRGANTDQDQAKRQQEEQEEKEDEEREEERRREKARKERIKKFTKQIHEFEQRIAHPPEVEDLSALNEELVSVVFSIH